MINLYDQESLKNLSAEDTFSSIYKAALLYGQKKDESIDSALKLLYENLIQYCYVSDRISLYRSVYSEVYSGETGSDALKPFICFERSHLVASTASLDYSVTNLVGNDELGAVDQLCKWISDHECINIAAVFAGILQLGDDRFKSRLLNLWKFVPDDQKKSVFWSTKPVLQHANVDFWLTLMENWAENMGVETGGEFSWGASAISIQLKQTLFYEVFDQRRVIPVPREHTKPAINLIKKWDFEEYAAYLEPRLEKLESQEGAGKIIPRIMMQLGLKPNTPHDNIYWVYENESIEVPRLIYNFKERINILGYEGLLSDVPRPEGLDQAIVDVLRIYVLETLRQVQIDMILDYNFHIQSAIDRFFHPYTFWFLFGLSQLAIGPEGKGHMTWTFIYLVDHVFPEMCRSQLREKEGPESFEVQHAQSISYNSFESIVKEGESDLTKVPLYKFLSNKTRPLPLTPKENHFTIPFDWNDNDWANADYKILMTWCIFNPNGPTVSVCGYINNQYEGVSYLFYRWLHFLNQDKQTQYLIGRTESTDSEIDLTQILKHNFGKEKLDTEDNGMVASGIPNLHWSATGHAEILAGLLQIAPEIQKADWGRELYLLSKYGNNLFDRAGEESRRSLERLRSEDPEIAETEGFKFTEARLEGIDSAELENLEEVTFEPFSKESFNKWRQITTSEKYSEIALFHLFNAWVGAISMYVKYNPQDNIKTFSQLNEWLNKGGCEAWHEELMDEHSPHHWGNENGN